VAAADASARRSRPHQIGASLAAHYQQSQSAHAASRELDMATIVHKPADVARVRYMVNNIAAAVEFYRRHFGFEVKRASGPNFAMLSRGNLELVLSTPFGPGGAAKPMLDGSKAEPGGWNRIIINVDDLASEVDNLRKAGLHFRSDILTGPGGSEVVIDDPSGNPIELFQPGRA
jgi:predicted enzyme related to lactoylglutathione lyase